jgi:flagellar basal-body rod protein FlgC
MSNALNVAATGVAASMEWLAAAAGNIANANDAAAAPAATYRTLGPVLAPVASGRGQGAGVTLAGVATGPPGRAAWDPGSPTANAQGVTFYPTDSLASQLTQADVAGLSAQANVAVMRHAMAAYQSLLDSTTPPAPGGA